MEFTDKKFRKESFQQGKDLVGKMIFDLRKEEEKRHEDRTDQDIEIAERVIDSIILQLRLIRDTGNASTLFAGTESTGDMSAVSFDVHIKINTLGSRGLYSK